MVTQAFLNFRTRALLHLCGGAAPTRYWRTPVIALEDRQLNVLTLLAFSSMRDFRRQSLQV